MTKPDQSLIFAFFENEGAADAAVNALKQWDKASPDIKLGNIGVLVKDDKGRIKAHKLGPRRTGTGAVLFGLAAVLTGGASLLGGLVFGGIVGSFFRKGIGLTQDDLAHLETELASGKAAVAVVANNAEAVAIAAKLNELGGVLEAHSLDAEAVEHAKAEALSAPPVTIDETPVGPDAAEQIKEAVEAFIYGYPLVYNLTEIAKFPKGTSLLGTVVPYNQFGYARQLLGPDAKFVSPNNDTLYLLVACNLQSGPLVLHVPDTNDRYYVLQFVDAWTNNFAYIGRRATGTAEANYLIAPAGYDGDVPDGMTVVRAPSDICVILGRITVNGVEDLPAAHALQDQFTVTPLSVYLGGAAPAEAPGVPEPDPRVGEDLVWWESFRVALAAFPPPAADAPYLAICEKLGLTADDSPFVSPDPEMAKLLVAAHQAGHAKIEELMSSIARTPNGWQDSAHAFDYNLDFFELGTLDTPEWKIADRTKAYVMRAVVARAGLWGNHGYEANYQMIFVDSDGQRLDSAQRYELHLESEPPVDAFWSLTMYDLPQFYLVENPIHRYSIGDRTPGLAKNADGSLTLYLQKDSPGPDKESNWLPTPQQGPFRPIMRLYQPGQAVLDGTYLLPAI